MLKKLIALLVFLVPCFTAHGSYAQTTFCTQDVEKVEKLMAEYGEVFLFSGISKMGGALFVLCGQEDVHGDYYGPQSGVLHDAAYIW